MKFYKIFSVINILFCSICVCAQPNDSLVHDIRLMTKQGDAAANLSTMKSIINKYKLQEKKDAESIDMMKGIVAMNYVEDGQYAKFEKMIASIHNKFDQTSYLSMAASNLLDKGKESGKAEIFAKQALELYTKIKDDPAARPDDFPEADWKRFMKFAYYPYCDTYARALFARGKYKEALPYQEEALSGDPENGMLSSVERYTELLVHNDRDEEAYSLLLKMTTVGKSTSGMNKLLKKLYTEKEGNDTEFDSFYADLQKNVVEAIKEKLKQKMQDTIAPAFTLKDVDGNTVSLSDFKGRTIVIDFWATWCLPCKASFPAMQKMAERHPEVKFLFIATQEKPEGAVDRVKKYITKNNYLFHVLMDKPGKNPEIFQVMTAYKVEGIPTKFIIDAKGKQRFSSVGFTSDTELINELEAMIQLLRDGV